MQPNQTSNTEYILTKKVCAETKSEAKRLEGFLSKEFKLNESIFKEIGNDVEAHQNINHPCFSSIKERIEGSINDFEAKENGYMHKLVIDNSNYENYSYYSSEISASQPIQQPSSIISQLTNEMLDFLKEYFKESPPEKKLSMEDFSFEALLHFDDYHDERKDIIDKNDRFKFYFCEWDARQRAIQENNKVSEHFANRESKMQELREEEVEKDLKQNEIEAENNENNCFTQAKKPLTPPTKETGEFIEEWSAKKSPEKMMLEEKINLGQNEKILQNINTEMEKIVESQEKEEPGNGFSEECEIENNNFAQELGGETLENGLCQHCEKSNEENERDKNTGELKEKVNGQDESDDTYLKKEDGEEEEKLQKAKKNKAKHFKNIEIEHKCQLIGKHERRECEKFEKIECFLLAFDLTMKIIELNNFRQLTGQKIADSLYQQGFKIEKGRWKEFEKSYLSIFYHETEKSYNFEGKIEILNEIRQTLKDEHALYLELFNLEKNQ